MKTCTRCKTIRQTSEFYKDSKSKDGLSYYCKYCTKDAVLKWIKNNKEKYKENYKRNYLENKQARIQYANNYYIENREKHKKRSAEYIKKRLLTDPMFKLSRCMRDRVFAAFKHKKWKKNSKTQEMLGADYKTVMGHIESRFKKGMTWDNQGEWHIDHIIPLASAKTEQELIQLCHYTNLQPLWAEENLSKGDKIIACRINL